MGIAKSLERVPGNRRHRICLFQPAQIGDHRIAKDVILVARHHVTGIAHIDDSAMRQATSLS